LEQQKNGGDLIKVSYRRWGGKFIYNHSAKLVRGEPLQPKSDYNGSPRTHFRPLPSDNRGYEAASGRSDGETRLRVCSFPLECPDDNRLLFVHSRCIGGMSV
jgi:hypothetical protein